ncbi:MAG TPA: hypothetical protein VK131_12975, partial [Candidatus Acidoferrales bacterium]|nr:hypothetical protein [Candidatus Acidoferrales bacterium]
AWVRLALSPLPPSGRRRKPARGAGRSQPAACSQRREPSRRAHSPTGEGAAGGHRGRGQAPQPRGCRLGGVDDRDQLQVRGAQGDDQVRRPPRMPAAGQGMQAMAPAESLRRAFQVGQRDQDVVQRQSRPEAGGR